MKPLLCLLSLLGFGYCSLADDFSDFRVPAHRVSRCLFDIYTKFNRNSEDSDNSGSKSSRLSQNGNAGMAYQWRSESDRTYLNVDLNGTIYETVARYESTSERFNDYYDYYYENSLSREYSLSQYASGSVGESIYPWQTLIGINGAMSGMIRYSQAGEASEEFEKLIYNGQSERRVWDDEQQEMWRQEYRFDMTIGPVFGKVRHVTPVATALVTEQKLIEEGVLSGALSSHNRQALAELFYREPTYSASHSRNERYFWSDVEALISNDPAFVAPLSAYVTHRINESYFGYATRLRGFAIKPVVSYQHENLINHYWIHDSEKVEYDTLSDAYLNEYYDRIQTNRDAATWGIQFDYHVPFGLNWQLDIASNSTYYPKEWYSPDSRTRLWRSSLKCDLYWLVADRWYTNATLSAYGEFLDEVGDESNHRNYQSTSLGLEVGYFIEDNVSITAEVSDNLSWSNQRGFRYGELTMATNSQRSTFFAIGLSYALQGALGPRMQYYPPYQL